MADKFVVGNQYFLLRYLDDDFHWPIITSIVFIGINLEPEISDEGDRWFFQDVTSFLAMGPYAPGLEDAPKTAEVEGEVYDFSADQLPFILTKSRLITELQRSN